MPSTIEILERLQILWHKLENDGEYVRANTVGLAIEEINRLSGQPDQRVRVIEECVLEAHKFSPNNPDYALGTLAAIEGICARLRALAIRGDVLEGEALVSALADHIYDHEQ